MRRTNPIWLIWRSDDGALFYQEVPALIDTETGRDMEMVGWTRQLPSELQP